VLTVAAIVAAVLIWYAMIHGRVDRARASCVERGGEVVVDLDARGVTYVQWCVLPDGTRELI
jgi:putative hemolysin